MSRDCTREKWCDLYSCRPHLMGNKPNQFLFSQLSDHGAGRILLPGEGTGRNVLHAAKSGWDANAFDISPAAQQRALRQAAIENVQLNYWLADFANPRFKRDFYDVIGIIDVHLDSNQLWSGLAELKHALIPGGTLILEAFAADNLQLPSPVGPSESDHLYRVEALRDKLKGDFDFGLLRTKYIERTDTRTYDAVVVQMVATKKP